MSLELGEVAEEVENDDCHGCVFVAIQAIVRRQVGAMKCLGGRLWCHHRRHDL